MPGWEIGYGRVLGFAMLVVATLTTAVTVAMTRVRQAASSVTVETPVVGSADLAAVDRRDIEMVGQRARDWAKQAGTKVAPVVRETFSRAPALMQSALAASGPLVEGISARAPQVREQMGAGTEALTTGGGRVLELQQRVAAGLAPAGQKGLETARKGVETAAVAARGAVETVRQSVVPQVSGVLEKAQPVVTLAVSHGVSRIRGGGIDLLKSSTAGGGEMVKGATASMAETAEDMQRKTAAAVKSGASAAASTTRDLFGILFWLAALGMVIMFVFVRNPETRARAWGYITDASDTIIRLIGQSMRR